MSVELKMVDLNDKFEVRRGRVLMTGTQALARLPMLQRERDAARGLDTAGFISGYRGSPLGGLDQQLARMPDLLAKHGIVFKPGLNEDLAATAIWGSQQAEMRGQGRHDGVFAMWYAKGPGVDRTGDVFRHGNLAGSSKHGGVIALLGDDHTCESSTTCHQSEFAMVDAMIPVLNPSGVQELIEFGLAGWALSRYSGCWVALKCVHDTVSATAAVSLDPDQPLFVEPVDAGLPPDGLSIRSGDTPRAQEVRLHRYKLKAVQAWARANRLDRIVIDSAKPKLCVFTTGKSYLDVVQALKDLGIGAAEAERLGLRVYKIGMPWPLEPEGAKAAAKGAPLVMVVEEKRGLIEGQLKDILFNQLYRPVVIGKTDEAGAALFRSELDLQANEIAIAIGARLAEANSDHALGERVRASQGSGHLPSTSPMHRTAYFCAGCPHSSSTKLPEGSRGMAGIGCAWMSQFMDREVDGYTQMGGEGASWIGEAPFSKTGHVFQNLGDGTYNHSGSLAIRAAVAAGSNITYKILFNDAVAMTGGQPHDGPLTPWGISRQVAAEGVAKLVVVTDDPAKYARDTAWAPGTEVHPREELDRVQRLLRETPGVTALIYDQTCAAEKRRRRKRKSYPDPAKRLFINTAVCEGCGDCGVASNCVAIVPVGTELGRKRAIDQSQCNKDYSCVEGFCPSFVTVLGGQRRRPAETTSRQDDSPLPPPPPCPITDGWSIVVGGVGGTGIVTIGAILAMAAHLEDKGFATLDMTGMAQKGGSVISHIRLASTQADISAVRIAERGADLLIGCDLVVVASEEALTALNPDSGRAIVNDHETMPGNFTRDRDLNFPAGALLERVRHATDGRTTVLPATDLAAALFGDTMAANLFLLGTAFQLGAIPLSADAIERAVELNGAAVPMNLSAFRAGRRAAIDPDGVRARAGLAKADTPPRTIDEAIEFRAAFLTLYQDAAYAARYRSLVERVRAAAPLDSDGLIRAVAESYFKLLAYKDEYEVARLYSAPEFRANLAATFEGEIKLRLNLAPPMFARRDPTTGHLKKAEFGAWMLSAFRVLARFKGLRGGPLDPFGYTAERRSERAAIVAYEALIETLIADGLSRDLALASELATLPLDIRGFGHVKEKAAAAAAVKQGRLLAEWQALGSA